MGKERGSGCSGQDSKGQDTGTAHAKDKSQGMATGLVDTESCTVNPRRFTALEMQLII